MFLQSSVLSSKIGNGHIKHFIFGAVISLAVFVQAADVTVVNADFSHPGVTTKLVEDEAGWSAINGWSADYTESGDDRAGEGGVDNNRLYGNSYINVYQLLSETIAAGQTYVMDFSIANSYRGETVTTALYYDNAGVRTVIVSETFEIDGSWAIRSISFDAAAGADYIGRPLGIEISGYGENNGNAGASWWFLDTISVTVNATDRAAPTPNPAKWDTSPTPNESFEITMTAQAGTDDSGTVEYYFDEISGNPGGDDSDWQSGNQYTDTGLYPKTPYQYVVRMRDRWDNVTGDSAVGEATTGGTIDLSGDGEINLLDFALIAEWWMTGNCDSSSVPWCDGSDLDLSGLVDISDLSKVITEWLSSPGQRCVTNIDRDWKFIQEDISGAEVVAYDDSAWRTLNVPHDWSIEGAYDASNPGGGIIGYLPTGIGWYRKHLTIPSDWQDRQVLIQFDGVFRKSTVYIDGVELGHRPYGWISFAYDITDAIAGKSEVVIAVHVDNSLQPAARWYTGSGIYGHVNVIVKNKLNIKNWGVFVTADNITSTGADISVQTDIQNKMSYVPNALLVHTVLNPEGLEIAASEPVSVAVLSGSEETLESRLTVDNPALWSPDNPALYTLRSRIVSENGTIVFDQLDTPFGIRIVSWQRDGFFLNGNPITIRGMCNHHDAGPLGAAVPDKILRARLQMLKDMGANAVRTSHNPQTPVFYDICDEIGLMVMDEIFDGWGKKAAQDYGALDFATWWETDATDWLLRDRNHPSIIIWSLGNETSGTTAATNLLALCHELDPTRLVTSGGANSTLMDVYGKNGGTERTTFTSNPSSTAPFVGTECVHSWHVRDMYRTQTWYRDGYDASTKLDISNLTTEEIFQYDWSSDHSYKRCLNSSYDNSTVRDCIRHFQQKVHTNDWLTGAFRWTGFDYIGEATYISGGWPFKLFNSGVIDISNFPKDNYYLYQSLWTDGQTAPMVHLLPHWTHPLMEANTEIPIWAYSNCDTVKLYLNDMLISEDSPAGVTGAWDQMQCEWMVPWQPGTLKAEGYVDNVKVCEEIVQTASIPAKLHLTTDTTDLQPDGIDMAQVTVAITDENDIPYPYGENRVYFDVFGPATIKAVGNGSPIDTESHRATDRNCFLGLAKAFVESTTAEGDVLFLAAGILGEKRQITSDQVSIHVDQIALRGTPSEKNVSIYYTTDGSTPDNTSTPYVGSFAVTLGTTVKAAIYVDGVEIISCQEEFSRDAGFYWGGITVDPNDSDGLQAEYAELSGATVNSSGSGWNGTGFVDFGSGEGSIEWAVTNDGGGETVTLEFRFANGAPSGDRPMELTINGTVIESAIAFPPTGSWNSIWDTVSATAILINGTNTIRLTTTGDSGVNVDQLEILFP